VRRLAAACAVTAVVVASLVAGTAGAQTTTTTATTKAPSRPAGPAGVTDTSIKVAGLGDSLLYGGADVGARARFQRANDTGGVNGRTIDYAGFTDDGGDPNAGTAAATKLVQDDGVFAVVPVVTPDFAASSFLVQQKVPYFGWALSSSFCGNRYGFGFVGCPVPASVTSNVWPLLMSKALPPNTPSPTAAILAEDTPSGKYELASLTAAAKSVKFGVVYGKTSLTSPSTVDFDAVVKEVVKSNNGNMPNVVFVVGNVSNVLGVQQALANNGYLGLFTNRIEYAPDMVALATNAYVVTPTAPVETASTNPAMQQLVADVQKVAPDQPIDESVIAGYWSADLFLAAVRKAGKKLTRASLLDAANRKFTYEVPDTVGPTKFPAAHSLPAPCGALVTSSGTAYSVKVPYTCGRLVRVE
jgi:ABC-type branched-subunit amino acid transport system substrate-binding protein